MTASDVAAIPAAARVNLPDDKPLIYIIQVQRNQFWATVRPSAFVLNGPRLVVVATLG